MNQILEADRDSEGEFMSSSPQAHPALSPAAPFESFFISSQLKTSNLSAFALAAQIHRNTGRSLSGRSNASGISVATDDFASTCENSCDLNAEEANYIHNYSDYLFGKDVLVHSREPILVIEEINYQDANEDMSTTDESTVNAAQQAYEGAKGVWTWGKGIPLLGFAEGVAEAVAKKLVSVAGTSFEDIDANVKPHISGLDKDILNPAINKIVGIIMAGISKGDATFRPIFMAIAPPILGPLGLMKIEGEKKTPEAKKPPVAVAAPEFTTFAAN